MEAHEAVELRLDDALLVAVRAEAERAVFLIDGRADAEARMPFARKNAMSVAPVLIIGSTGAS